MNIEERITALEQNQLRMAELIDKIAKALEGLVHLLHRLVNGLAGESK